MKTDSGNLRTGLPADPKIRFQKRDRDQLCDVIVPVSKMMQIFLFSFFFFDLINQYFYLRCYSQSKGGFPMKKMISVSARIVSMSMRTIRVYYSFS